jgi:hypothetical protein
LAITQAISMLPVPAGLYIWTGLEAARCAIQLFRHIRTSKAERPGFDEFGNHFRRRELEHFGCCMALSRVRIQSIGDAEVLLTARSQHQSTTWRRQEIAKRSLSKSHSVKRVVLKIEDVAAA